MNSIEGEVFSNSQLVPKFYEAMIMQCANAPLNIILICVT